MPSCSRFPCCLPLLFVMALSCVVLLISLVAFTVGSQLPVGVWYGTTTVVPRYAALFRHYTVKRVVLHVFMFTCVTLYVCLHVLHMYVYMSMCYIYLCLHVLHMYVYMCYILCIHKLHTFVYMLLCYMNVFLHMLQIKIHFLGGRN